MNQQLQLFDDLSRYEGSDIEYKSARGGLPRDLWETYSAFANTDGGTICLGVAQRADQSLDVHGVEDAEKLLNDFWNTVNNRSKVSCNLLANQHVSARTVEGTDRTVVFIEVPRAGRRERPVYLGANPLTNTFRRNFQGDYRCTENEVRRMFADQSEEPADSQILPGFSLTDLDPDSIRQFRNRWTSRTSDHAWLALDDRALLERLGGWRRSRRSDGEGITLAGLAMFGKTQAITAPEALPGFQLDYRERLSEDPGLRWTDRLTIDGTWEANLFQFYQRVIARLTHGPGIKLPFVRDSEGYRLGVTQVHEALQEALVNALIHADYRGQGGIVIDRYADRIEFSNPGTLLVSREQLLRGGISECRNRSVQLMFQMLGVGDKAGSGIDKIRTNWEAQAWQSPSLQETVQPDRVRLVLPMISVLPEELLSDLGRRFGSPFVRLSRNEVQAIVVAATEGVVSNQRLQEMLPLHRVDITTLLQGLVREGFLLPEGVGRGTRYTLRGGEIPIGTAQIMPANEDFSPANEGFSPVKQDFSPANEGFSPVKEALAGDPLNDPALFAIARPVREAARSARDRVTGVILELCESRFLTIQQLAALLNRKPKALRDDYVSDLVIKGELELRFPSNPKHRNQAYKRRTPQ